MEGIEIPYERLSEHVLWALIEEFVLREGTDYGQREYALKEKIDDVLGQLKRQKAVIVFDPTTETFDIVVKA